MQTISFPRVDYGSQILSERGTLNLEQNRGNRSYCATQSEDHRGDLGNSWTSSMCFSERETAALPLNPSPKPSRTREITFVSYNTNDKHNSRRTTLPKFAVTNTCAVSEEERPHICPVPNCLRRYKYPSLIFSIFYLLFLKNEVLYVL